MDKLIRNIPDETAKELRRQAKAKGLTLEAYIRMLLIQQALQDSETEEKKKP